jgi:hypothetical protein
MPSKQPNYREHRAHVEFLANLNVSADIVKHALQTVWKAGTPLEVVPRDQIAFLARDKYATKKWNRKF